MKKKLLIGLSIALVLMFVVRTIPVQAQSGSLKLYGIIGSYLVEVNAATGQATEVAELWGAATTYVGPLAFDPITKKLYSLADRFSEPKLATIDLCTGEVSVIGPIILNGKLVYFTEGIAINPQGVIYASVSANNPVGVNWDYESETLVTLDPNSGAATHVVKINGTKPYTGGRDSEADGLEFVGDTLYATDDDGDGPTDIFTINILTGWATWLNELHTPRFNNVNDMAYNSDTGLLYGFDPGANLPGYSRYLCTISTIFPATATPIGITHTADEFGGARMSGLAWASVECCPPFVTDLWVGAGQNDTSKGTNVGTVTVTNDAENLYVTYEITNSSCYMTEVHLYVGKLGPGTAAPGKFPYKEVFIDNPTEWTLTIPLLDLEAVCEDALFLAAHAKVCCVDTYVQCETAWGFGSYDFSFFELRTKKWGWVFDYRVCCN